MDVVTWTPGRVGKGWVFPDGRVRAWNVNNQEQPHHKDVEHPDGSVRFRISPEGDVEMHGGDPWHREAAARALATAAA